MSHRFQPALQPEPGTRWGQPGQGEDEVPMLAKAGQLSFIVWRDFSIHSPADHRHVLFRITQPVQSHVLVRPGFNLGQQCLDVHALLMQPGHQGGGLGPSQSAIAGAKAVAGHRHVAASSQLLRYLVQFGVKPRPL